MLKVTWPSKAQSSLGLIIEQTTISISPRRGLTGQKKLYKWSFFFFFKCINGHVGFITKTIRQYVSGEIAFILLNLPSFFWILPLKVVKLKPFESSEQSNYKSSSCNGKIISL
jgi:hypothetical protein